MSVSQTKQQVIQRHMANTLLQAPVLPTTQRTPSGFSMDQPSAVPDPRIIAAVAQALDEGHTHYVDVPGIAPLRGKLTEFLTNLGHVALSMDEVVVTAGIQEARFLAIQVMAERLAPLAIPQVVHPGVRLAVGVRPVAVNVIPGGVDEGCLPTIAGIESALQAGNRLVFLESPSRLTGASFDSSSVDAIARLIARHDAAVIWDQGLAPWAIDPPLVSLVADPSSVDRVTVIGEAWPGLGLEGWFIGYIGTHRSGVDPIKTLKQVMSICTSTPSQFAALAAADLFLERHGAQVAALRERRDEVAAVARAAGWTIFPGSTVNLLAVSRAGDDSPPMDLGVGIEAADGTAFGTPGVLRIAITEDTVVADALSGGDGSRKDEV